MLCFEHVLIDPKVHGICSKMPRWVEPMPSLICENPKVFMGHTPLVIHEVGFNTEIILARAVNERSCIKEVGVDLEP